MSKRNAGLAYRQLVLLNIIANETKSREDYMLYFVPRRRGNWSEVERDNTVVSGSGDAAILRKFERDGLTENAHSPVNPYCCRITEKGLASLNLAEAAWKLVAAKGGTN